MNWFNDLNWRGLVNSITNEEKINNFDKSKKGVYVGFDPSAPSLHLGNFVMILMLRRMKLAGFQSIAVIGGATGMIGDPSGKSSERNLLDKKTIEYNKSCIIEQLKKYAKCDIFIDNYDFYKDMNFLDFLRDIGKFVNVNEVLQKEIVKTRLESTGISYTEFSYNIMQAYDFSQLYKNYDVWMQMGGSDQWGNITSGIEIIRKIYGDNNNACGITINLLTTADGKKFGKSEKGAIFLDPKMTSPYEMYQYLINQNDADVIKLLKFLTLLTKEEITEIEQKQKSNPAERLAQKTLANWIITEVHGKEELDKVKLISSKLFEGNIKNINIDDLKIALKNVPSTELKNNNYKLIDLLIEMNIASSKTQIRELLSSNGIMVNGEKVNDENLIITKNNSFSNEFIIVKKGKKNYFIGKWN